MYYPLGRVVGVSPVVVPGFVPLQGFVPLLYTQNYLSIVLWRQWRSVNCLFVCNHTVHFVTSRISVNDPIWVYHWFPTTTIPCYSDIIRIDSNPKNGVFAHWLIPLGIWGLLFVFIQYMIRRGVCKTETLVFVVYLINLLTITAVSVGDSVVLPIQIRSNPILPYFSDYSTNGNNHTHA